MADVKTPSSINMPSLSRLTHSSAIFPLRICKIAIAGELTVFPPRHVGRDDWSIHHGSPPDAVYSSDFVKEIRCTYDCSKNCKIGIVVSACPQETR